jgi:hypothetical protein
MIKHYTIKQLLLLLVMSKKLSIMIQEEDMRLLFRSNF